MDVNEILELEVHLNDTKDACQNAERIVWQENEDCDGQWDIMHDLLSKLNKIIEIVNSAINDKRLQKLFNDAQEEYDRQADMADGASY